jgi:predicted nucleotidyltransferase
MRLNNQQISIILEVIHKHLGPEAGVFLYGSRLDTSRQGGDIDLLVTGPDDLSALAAARAQVELQELLHVAVDLNLVHDASHPTPFQEMVMEQAVPVEHIG